MAPGNPALAGWVALGFRAPFNWRLLGIAFCDKSFIGLQANPYKPWAPRAAAKYPPSSPATTERKRSLAPQKVCSSKPFTVVGKYFEVLYRMTAYDSPHYQRE